jgi:hypothetical protein
MKRNNKTSLVVKYDIGTHWFLNHGGKNFKYFPSVKAFVSHIKNSLNSIYNSDLEKVYKYVFDPKEMDTIFRQIDNYASRYDQKAKSLAFNQRFAIDGEEETDWDMQIIFRRSLENMSKNSDFKLHPKLTANQEFGQIIAPREKEVSWSDEKIEKFITSLK